MAPVNKPRIIKDYNKLDKALQEQIKLVYADGFADRLIHFFDKDGIKVSVLPFETENMYYMLRMTKNEAIRIVDEDDDFDDDGLLKSEVKQGYEDKYADLDHIADQISEDDDMDENMDDIDDDDMDENFDDMDDDDDDENFDDIDDDDYDDDDFDDTDDDMDESSDDIDDIDDVDDDED